MTIPSGGQPLDEVIGQQIESVDRRVTQGGGGYSEEIEQVRVAAQRVREIREQLGLGDFVRSLTPRTGKPQFLLVFESGAVMDGAPQKVLKVYGRWRPGEGIVQREATQLGLDVAPTIAYGDEPTSWLLMEPVIGRDLGQVLAEDPSQLLPRTTELAGIVHAVSTSVNPNYPGSQSLEAGILRHLDVVVGALVRHGYQVPDDWRENAIAGYRSGRKAGLHNDLFKGNMRVWTAGPRTGRLAVFDWASDSCIGAPEFDGARWVVRSGTPATFDEIVAAWAEGAGSIDGQVFRRQLANETLMQAGVIEIIKDEQGLPWQERDPATLELLDYYRLQRELQLEVDGGGLQMGGAAG